MAHITCCSLPLIVEVTVLGRPVLDRPVLLRLVPGRGVVVVSPKYEVEVVESVTSCLTLRDMMACCSLVC